MAKKIKNKNLMIKIICLLLSFGLWLYINNIENPVREKVITDIPVELINPQILQEQGLALAPNQDVTVSLSISGPAAEVYKINKSQFRVAADLISYGLKPGENNIPVSIMNSPSGINIKNNYPRVELNLENLQKKNMSLTPEVQVKEAKGSYLKNIKLSPLSASVEGAEGLVKEVSKLVVRGQVDNANQSTVLNLPIIPVNSAGVEIKGLTVTPGQADVAINLEKGKLVSIKVNTTGVLPQNLTLKSITPSINSVDIVGEGSKDINSLTTTPIDLSKITGNATIPVNITIPKGIVNISGENSINVNIVVENNSATKKISVPLDITGQNKDYDYKIGQNNADISITGLATNLEKLDLSKLVGNIDVSTLTSTGIVPIKIIGQDLQGMVVTVIPENISVEVSKKEIVIPPVVDPTTPPNPDDKPVVDPSEPTNDSNKPVDNPSKPITNVDKPSNSPIVSNDKKNSSPIISSDEKSNSETTVDNKKGSETDKVLPSKLIVSENSKPLENSENKKS
ncbi:YbbR-like domain-containing protein [uncultured Clostridium sp.]|uniref:CdaR family protein n=1 Tax=uncultured Clostridium sp. TaxID=59620 RepID=UPI00260A185B|nr:CdaR family protein [uncultured Clostridium sp.]